MTTAVHGETPAAARLKLWRVTDRASFQALRTDGHRVRRNGISLTWLAPAPDAALTPPKAAFAIGRRAGGAVVRNRIQRRLRAGLRALQHAGALPGGTYLLSGGGELASRPWDELVATLGEAVAAATGRASR